MRKSIIALTAVLAIGLSSATFAASLSSSMESLSNSFKAAQSAESAQDLSKALNSMRDAALESKNFTPKKLQGQDKESTEMQAFRQSLDDMVAQIDKSIALSDTGKVAEAKKELDAVKPMIGAGHKRFR